MPTSTTAIVATVNSISTAYSNPYNKMMLLPLEPVTSSGVYFKVGEAEKFLIFLANASTSHNGSIVLNPGSSKWAGSLGYVTSTESTCAYSTVTAPFPLLQVACLVSSDSHAAIIASTGNFALMGPFESETVKSTDGYIFIHATTLSTDMYASVVKLPGGSS